MGRNVSRACLLPLTALMACGGTTSVSSAGGGDAGGTLHATTADGGEAACAAFDGCGGDLTGTWTIAALCETGLQDPIKVTCPTGSSTYVWTVAGSYTFNTDGTFSNVVSMSLSETLWLPAACLGGAQTCPSLEPEMMQSGGPAVRSSTCTGNVSDACTCVQIAGPSGGSLAGTFTVSGTSLTLNPSSGKTLTYVLCVQGNVLKMQATTGQYTTTLTATKG
jgi:hypothetical protein